MLRLDLQTLVFVLIALNVAIGAPLAWIMGPRRGTGALWYWAMALLALASGSLLLVLRGIIPLLASIMFGNALIICAVALLGNVVASLTKQFVDGSARWFLAVITAPVLGLLYLMIDPIWPRVAYMAAVESYVVGQLAWQLRTSRMDSTEPQRKSVFAFEVLLWVFLGETIIRIFSALAFNPAEPFLQQSLISVAFLIAILLVATGTCVLIWHELDIKEAAMKFARSTNIASGLPNRVVFLQMLEGRLRSMAATGDGSVALLRVRPLVEGGARLNPFEEAAVYRKVGARIEQFLDRTDLLARVSEDEFGILFRGNEIALAIQALERALTDLQSRLVPGDRGRYLMNGTATLIACSSSIGSAAEVTKFLRDRLDGVTMGDVKVLSRSFASDPKWAVGTSNA
jgi:GGDEF domain-containing protein